MEDWRLAMCPAAEGGYELRCLMGEIINSLNSRHQICRPEIAQP
jgi:hypothetical protein